MATSYNGRFTVKRSQDGKRVELCPPPIVKFFAWVAGLVGSLTLAGVAGILTLLLDQSAGISENKVIAAEVRDDVGTLVDEVKEIDNRLDVVEDEIIRKHSND